MLTVYGLRTDGVKLASDTMRIAYDIALNARNVEECESALLDNVQTRQAFVAIPDTRNYVPSLEIAHALVWYVNRDKMSVKQSTIVRHYMWVCALQHVCGDKGALMRFVEVATKIQFGITDNCISPVNQSYDFEYNSEKIEVGGAGKSFPHISDITQAAKHFDTLFYYCVSAQDIFNAITDENAHMLDNDSEIENLFNDICVARLRVISAVDMPKWIQYSEIEYEDLTGRHKSLLRTVNAQTRDSKTGEIHQTRAKHDYIMIRGENKPSLDALYNGANTLV